MDPATVQALRDAKALKDEGILTEEEFKAKKTELLARKPKAAPPAPAPAPKAEKKEKKARKKKDEAGDAAPPKEKKAKKAAPLTLQDAGADGVLVTGDGTFRAKGLLSSNGGSWSKKLKAWVFGKGKAAELAAALQASASPPVELTIASPSPGAKAAREQSLESAKAAAIKKAAASGAEASLELAAHKKAVIVRGDTRKVKELLSALGGSWNNKLDGWVFPGKERAAVLDALRKDPTNTVTDDGKGEAPSQSPPAEDAEAAVAAVVADIPDDPYASPPEDADAKPPPRASSGRKSKADRRSGSLGSSGEPAQSKRKSVEDAEECLPEEPEKRRRADTPPEGYGYSA